MAEQLILICDDQKTIHETLGVYIVSEGYRYESAFDGQEALEKCEKLKPDLVVLDIMMPKMNGLDVCRELRKKSNVPIILLTAKGEEIDRVLGLELGADDYIVKPFSPREVAARIKAVLRRLNDSKTSEPENYAMKSIEIPGGLEINLTKYEVRVNGKNIGCTPKEVEILYLLASRPGQVFEREQILSSVWGYDFFGDTRAVDTQIKRIRQKLPQEGVPYAIRTIYGVGYKFEIFE